MANYDDFDLDDFYDDDDEPDFYGDSEPDCEALYDDLEEPDIDHTVKSSSNSYSISTKAAVVSSENKQKNQQRKSGAMKNPALDAARQTIRKLNAIERKTSEFSCNDKMRVNVARLSEVDAKQYVRQRIHRAQHDTKVKINKLSVNTGGCPKLKSAIQALLDKRGLSHEMTNDTPGGKILIKLDLVQTKTESEKQKKRLKGKKKRIADKKKKAKEAAAAKQKDINGKDKS